MTKSSESLNETFNIIPSEETVDITPIDEGEVEVISGSKSDDREADYQFARENLYGIISKMQETLDGALEVAQDSDHPRAFEVAFQGAKHLSDVVDKLQDLHAKDKKISEEPSTNNGSQINNGSVTNNVFMTGKTTAEMLKMVKEVQEEDK